MGTTNEDDIEGLLLSSVIYFLLIFVVLINGQPLLIGLYFGLLVYTAIGAMVRVLALKNVYYRLLKKQDNVKTILFRYFKR
jgi:hypothetical protein